MQDRIRQSRLLYVLEAALEYFIAIAVGTVYLAKITAAIGMSDALTGILSAFVSLGCGFQLFAVFLVNKHPVKRWVTGGHIVSQLLFACVYFIPLTDLAKTGKAVLLVVVLLTAHLLHNIINAPKTNWFMSLVEDGQRGRFTATKEIVSLLGGIAFTYALGAVMDGFEARGNIRGAFAVCGVGICLLMVLHSLTLLFSVEKPQAKEPVSVKQSLGALLRSKALPQIILVSVLWNVANYATLSFTGSYQTKELAFTTTFSSLVIMAGSLVRAAISPAMGRFADRCSFRRMLSLCILIETVAFAVNSFTVPANGKLLYPVYYILYCIGMAGINSTTINLIYDYVEEDRRTSALALQQTCAGLCGFLTVLLLSPLVERMQASAPTLGGRPLYAQQLLSLISCGVTLLLFLYVNTVIKRLKRVSAEPATPADM